MTKGTESRKKEHLALLAHPLSLCAMLAAVYFVLASVLHG